MSTARMSTTTPLHDTLRGKVIWIMGASSGIGKALATLLAFQGATLVLSSRNEEALTALKNSLPGNQHIVLPVDAEPAQVTEAFTALTTQVDRIHSAIFMSATYRTHGNNWTDIDFITNALQVNIGGAFYMVAHLKPYFEQQGFGQLVICSSVAGYRGLPSGQPYCATKAALHSLCESLYVELTPKNIDVKVISPGFVDTPLTQKNAFPMPMMISAERAAELIVKGIRSSGFEIHFPKKLTLPAKLMRLLPQPLYFWLMKRLHKTL